MSSCHRTAWSEILSDSKGLPEVLKITGKLGRRWGGGTVAIASPIT